MATDYDFPTATPDADQSTDSTIFVEDEAPPEMANAPRCKACNLVIEVEPGKKGRKPSYHPACRPSSQGKPSSTPRRKKSKNGPDYEEGLNGLFQMLAFGLTIPGTKNPVFAADSAAVSTYGPNISAAINQLALEKPEVASALDRLLAVGPYTVLIAAVAPLMMQIASNHGISLPGVPSAEEFMAPHVEAMAA